MAESVSDTAECPELHLVQEAEKIGAASEGGPPGKQAAGKSPKEKQSKTQPKQLDPGAYPGKESVGFFREPPAHMCSFTLHTRWPCFHHALVQGVCAFPASPSAQGAVLLRSWYYHAEPVGRGL